MMGIRLMNLIEGWLEKRKEENARHVVAVVKEYSLPGQLYNLGQGPLPSSR